MPTASSSAASNHPPASTGGPRALVGVARLLHIALETTVANETAGTKLGACRLVEKIGEGGFSTVWRAEQEEPVRRTVAVKILKCGLDSEEWAARFAVELQALALMEHPNIARVFDAGATPQGRPFFVMELVRSETLTRYCDAHLLPLPERLRLFASICHAVQHAHQKGVIHRDLKPSNVLVALVDGEPVAKIIDFGIAKATAPELAAAAQATQRHEFLGTPAYMSPEQLDLAGCDIDTRADIYSLGALLYELLCGCAPFDPEELAGTGLEAMRCLVRDIDPPRPSARLASFPADRREAVAAQRGIGAAELVKLLRLDLDWIAMRCLEKDRARRYNTAEALAADVARYLLHEPLDARPPSRAYRLRKSLRRHRGVFSAAAAMAGLLIVGATTSTWLAVRATHAEREAAAQAQLLRRRNYASDMLLAQQAHTRDDLGQVWRLLSRHRPGPGETDLRGWEWRYLWQFCRGDPSVLLNEHPLHAEGIAVSPDGAWLATVAHESAIVELRDLRTGGSKTVPYAPTPAATALVAFSPVAPLLAIHYPVGVPDQPGSARLVIWNYARDVPEKVLELPHRRLGSGNLLAFSADGARLIAAFGSDPVILSVADGSVVTRLRNDWMGCTAASADLRLVAFEHGNNSVLVNNTATGEMRHFPHVAAEYVNALAFSPDSRVLATAGGGTDAVIHLWALETGREISVHTGHHVAVQRMFFQPDGRTLVSGAHDQTIRLWDLDSGRCTRVLRGHQAGLFDLAALPGGQRFVSSARDGTVRLWDASVATDRRPDLALGETIASWRFATDGTLLTIDQHGDLARRFPPAYTTAAALAHLGPDFIHSWEGRICLAAGRPWAAIVTSDRRAQVWDWESGRLVAERRADESPGPPRSLAGFVDGDRRLLFNYGGGPRGPRGLAEWNLAAPAAARTWAYAAPGHVPATTVSPDSRWCLASWNTNPFSSRASDLGPVQLIDLQSGRATPLPQAVLWWSGTAAFSPSGTALALPWSRATTAWRLPAEPLPPLPPALCAAYSPDGGRLVLGNSRNEVICLADAATGEPLFSLPAGHTGFTRVAFSADGNTLAAQSQFGALHLWTAPSWEEIATAERTDPAWIIHSP